MKRLRFRLPEFVPPFVWGLTVTPTSVPPVLAAARLGCSSTIQPQPTAIHRAAARLRAASAVIANLTRRFPLAWHLNRPHR